jgi:hypothetical protein
LFSVKKSEVINAEYSNASSFEKCRIYLYNIKNVLYSFCHYAAELQNSKCNRELDPIITNPSALKG